ncbi:MAG: hypothetical protein OXH12_12945 [Chloroflexi bacterium]|nr:hypothetical protein [Chloroflexota bacterium]
MGLSISLGEKLALTRHLTKLRTHHVARDLFVAEAPNEPFLSLVPATMQLLGERSRYFPRFLQWVPRIGIEGAAVEAGPPPSRIDP